MARSIRDSTLPGPADPERRGYLLRKAARISLRVAWVILALFCLLVMIGVFVEAPADESIAVTTGAALVVAGVGLAPLATHTWWARNHPIADPALANRPRTHADSLRTKLAQITDAADELKRRGWSTSADHRAVEQRVHRLIELVDADEISVQRGGRISPVIEPEIDQLRDRVLGILDAAINSAAIAPGDTELDNRLQAQLDALHARQRAVNELEGRPQPGY